MRIREQERRRDKASPYMRETGDSPFFCPVAVYSDTYCSYAVRLG
jgi:hypothetical protein